ncbi:uncharacterized protein LOC129581021 isoform X2 [Paramacrobiotus metropolitanus]|uniref:uncharacterized protein LOC129581021 isoform X2 n=1 Tax=Paramacrobiotus metropolitanus TaxID=2943436 RepID=UPI0024465696|nr:uncharacterized protein LOC129581021 isoform X2 [Paramacrobiotus metropolitanus]
MNWFRCNTVEVDLYQRRLSIGLNWLQLFLYVFYLFYIGLSLYFFYIGLSAFSSFPVSGTFFRIYPLAFQTSRVASTVTVCFAMIMLVTGVMGKFAVRMKSGCLLIAVILMQTGISVLLTGTAIYAHVVMLDEGTMDNALHFSPEDKQHFIAFLHHTANTATGLAAAVIMGTILTLTLFVLLKVNARLQQKRRASTADTLELFEAEYQF